MEYDYNSLNLLSEVRRDRQPAAKYDWLADGTKLGVRDGSGTEGFEYVGSLIYRKNGSGLHLCEALFGEGAERLRIEHKPLEIQRQGIADDGGFLDYGARMYDMSVGRWFGMDPLAEKYSSQSGYVFCGNNPLLFVDENGGFFTHYVDKDYNVLFQTDDGSDDVVMVPDVYVGDFLKYSDFSSGLDDIFNSLGCNKYWKDKFGLADRQFSELELMLLDGFNTGWSRNNAAKYLLKPTAGRLISMSFSESLSQWTNPELVVGNLSAGAIGWSNVLSIRNYLPKPFTKSNLKLGQAMHIK